MATRKLLKKATDSVRESATEELELKPLQRKKPIDWKKTLSTGSTLLDLALSSGRTHGGGVPAGILLEVYGRSGSGKTSILSELCAAAQSLGGEISYLDPEARLDTLYAKTYGMDILREHYHKPDTVTEMFDIMSKWKPGGTGINVMAADSLAALSTELEMEKGDKMGMRRAKEFSEGLRKHCRLIEKNDWIIACSNQVRQGDYGDVTPGGKAVEFYSSARISVNQAEKITKKRKLEGKSKEIERVIGIKSKCVVTKSSIDKPFREAYIYIIFDYGIDDIRGNLQFIKDTEELSKYRAVDKEFQVLDAAIKHIESNNLEHDLKEEVIELWHTIEERFRQERKQKGR